MAAASRGTATLAPPPAPGPAGGPGGALVPIPVGRGLFNATGSFNCFVNVCAQLVWNCASARTSLAALGKHTCFRLVGDERGSGCMLCALRGTCPAPLHLCDSFIHGGAHVLVSRSGCMGGRWRGWVVGAGQYCEPDFSWNVGLSLSVFEVLRHGLRLQCRVVPYPATPTAATADLMFEYAVSDIAFPERLRSCLIECSGGGFELGEGLCPQPLSPPLHPTHHTLLVWGPPDASRSQATPQSSQLWCALWSSGLGCAGLPSPMGGLGWSGGFRHVRESRLSNGCIGMCTPPLPSGPAPANV
jgi:hypothetical protein